MSKCVADEDVHAEGLRVATLLAAGPASALSWTKRSLNHWYRTAQPLFEASLGLEFFGFGGHEVVEGLAAHRGKRAPDFEGVGDKHPIDL